jgi:isopentenyl diphosphate isomerase/L-lactate dehydrogenase-like FMN-dependent dehydrogenase
MSNRSLSIGSPRLASIDDLRLLAQRRLPRIVFDYIDGGAEGEITLKANRQAFEAVTFRPRHAVSIQNCSLETSVLNLKLSLPVLLAPIGYSSVLYPKGELAAARAAATAGTTYILSTVSAERLEDVNDCCRGLAWYQLYLWGGREAAEGIIERARRAHVSALVVTVDSSVGGKRERDIRNGVGELLACSSASKIPFLWQLLMRPRWLADYLRYGGISKLANVVVPGIGPLPLTDIRYAAVTWQDVRWIRELWKGPIVVKGILTGDDAKRSLDEGADAVVVSNHGGRQLDGVPSSLRALSEVVAAVGDRTEILLDSGIRRGSDIVKAICLGARAVLCGRAFAYGLAAAGEAGVTCALNILRDDLERTLQLIGCHSIDELNDSYVSR